MHWGIRELGIDCMGIGSVMENWIEGLEDLWKGESRLNIGVGF